MSESDAGGASPLVPPSYAIIPLYLVNIGGDQFKIGLKISLQPGAPALLYEFDTGASGFYPAAQLRGGGAPLGWWSSFTDEQLPITYQQQYSSGNIYTALSTPATLQFEGTAFSSLGLPLGDIPSVTANVGAIVGVAHTSDAAKGTGGNGNTFVTQWEQALQVAELDFTKHLTPVGFGPLDGSFFGDFGIGLGGAANFGEGNPASPPVLAVFPQIVAPLCDCFTVALRPYPTAQQISDLFATPYVAVPWGSLTLGTLLPAQTPPFTFMPMVAGTTSETYPNSNLPTFAQGLVDANLSVSLQEFEGPVQNFTANSVNLVLDTGAPSMMIHWGTPPMPGTPEPTCKISQNDVAPFLSADGKTLLEGSDLRLAFSGSSSIGLNFTTGDVPGQTLVAATGLTATTKPIGYINTSIQTFFGYIVQYNLGTGQIGFAPQPTA